jgi:hypothetical protein
VVERDEDRYRGRNDEYDCVTLELVISAIVLDGHQPSVTDAQPSPRQVGRPPGHDRREVVY